MSSTEPYAELNITVVTGSSDSDFRMKIFERKADIQNRNVASFLACGQKTILIEYKQRVASRGDCERHTEKRPQTAHEELHDLKCLVYCSLKHITERKTN